MYDFVHIPTNTYAYMCYVAVFRDNRFIVVVSCYDVVADSLTVQKAKDTVVRDVRKAVDQQIHQDNVCVVCGKWALLARKCLVEGGGDVERFVRWALEHPSIPRYAHTYTKALTIVD